MDNWNPIRDWNAGQLAIAESRAARRARWSRVKLVALPIIALLMLAAYWYSGK